MNFIDYWNKGNFEAKRVLTTLLLIVLVYLASSSFLFFDLYLNFPNSDLVDQSSIKDLSLLMGKNRLFLWMMLPFSFIFVTLLICLTKIHQLPFLKIFTSRDKFDWKRFFVAFSLWSLMVVTVTALELMLNADFEIIFNAQKFMTLFFLSIILLPIQTSAEELIFRGYVLQGVNKRTGNAILSVVISGLMFGMMHISNPEIAKMGYHILIYYVAVGIVLGFIVYFDSGLELTLGFHAANNLITALLITSDWQAFQTDAIIKDNNPPGNGFMGIFFAFIMLCLFFFILKKKYSWKGIPS
jgi:membrane protease YdiL (CAAX protease family)